MIGSLKSWISSILSLLHKPDTGLAVEVQNDAPISFEDDGRVSNNIQSFPVTDKYEWKFEMYEKIYGLYGMRPTLSACMVIKNEEAVIVRSLTSLIQLADEIVIIDTGSTDGTIKTIRSWASKYAMRDKIELIEVGDKFHDENGNFHFGNAKNAAILEASCDYVIWLDGSDYISDPKKLRQLFLKAFDKTENFYISTPSRLSSAKWMRSRIFPYGKAKFTGAVHETLQFHESLSPFIADVEIVHQSKGSRVDSIKRNLKILESDWKLNRTPRNAFYLANSYFDIQDYESAIEYFNIRITEFDVNSFPQETFKSYENVCEAIYLLKDKKYLELMDEYTEEMIDLYPDRKESHYYRGLYFIAIGNKKSAYEKFSRVLSLKTPHDGVMWNNPNIYNDVYIHEKLQMCRN